MPGDVYAGTQPVIPSESSAASVGSGNFQVTGLLENPQHIGDYIGNPVQEKIDKYYVDLAAAAAKQDEKDHNDFYKEFGLDIGSLSDSDKELVDSLFEYYQKFKETGDSAWYEKLFETIYNLKATSSARKWEEEMSNTAFSRLVADIEKAGYNPWIALQSGYGQASTPSVSAAQSSNVSKSEQDTQRYAAKLNLLGQVINGLFRMIGGIL